MCQETTNLGEAKDELLARVRLLRNHGHFDEFVEAALAAADARSNSAALQLLKTEALLALGRSEEAEAAAERAAALALEGANLDLSVQALKLWVVARFRRQQPIKNPFSDALLSKLPPSDPAVEMLRFWCDSLGRAAPFRIGPRADGKITEIPARSSSGSVSADLNAIEVRANGVSMPLAFIDTGAQHTLMTVEAARAAGVKFGSRHAQLIGFAKMAARAGLLTTLELGGLTLENVPVLVGDSAPLLATKGQMALGTELMHHVRFTLDYPHRRVFVDRGDGPPPVEDRQPVWQIPLWTFPQACLAQGRLAPGIMARVLVDTGDRAGTFVSARWARRSLPGFERPDSNLIFKYKQRNIMLDELGLGNQFLYDWSVVDTMPKELERLDIVDVLMGHDLLWPYQVTIDLGRRVLLLQGGPPPAVHN
ncbi:MAG: aspartyl protease family protein [Planctomycetia bacterium]|nr:aspartyl protease family protein [Planctomycetia bacterium]